MRVLCPGMWVLRGSAAVDASFVCRCVNFQWFKYTPTSTLVNTLENTTANALLVALVHTLVNAPPNSLVNTLANAPVKTLLNTLVHTL